MCQWQVSSLSQIWKSSLFSVVLDTYDFIKTLNWRKFEKIKHKPRTQTSQKFIDMREFSFPKSDGGVEEDIVLVFLKEVSMLARTRVF